MIKLLKIDNLVKDIKIPKTAVGYEDELYKVVMGAVLEAMPLIEGSNIYQRANDLVSSGIKSWYQRKMHSIIQKAQKADKGNGNSTATTATELEKLIVKAQRAKEALKEDEGLKILYSWVLHSDNIHHPYASLLENQAEYLNLTEQLSRCKKSKTPFRRRLCTARDV